MPKRMRPKKMKSFATIINDVGTDPTVARAAAELGAALPPARRGLGLGSGLGSALGSG